MAPSATLDVSGGPRGCAEGRGGAVAAGLRGPVHGGGRRDLVRQQDAEPRADDVGQRQRPDDRVGDVEVVAHHVRAGIVAQKGDAAEEDRHPFLRRAGPDILDAKLTVESVAERLAGADFRNRALGNLYLDQGFLAGNGNYLRSETLWAARLNPFCRPSALDAATLKRLARQTLAIAWRSYRTRGVTVPEKVARERRAAGMTYEQYRFQVYGRDGLPCYRCGATVERLTCGSRSVFICPECQAR